MNKCMLIIGLIAATSLLGAAAPEKEKVQPQTTCPVMGGNVNKALFAEYGGKRIYVCCKECLETVKNDPVKYIRDLEAGGVTLEKVQANCPVMGGEINKKVFADHNGKRVYFCCPGCIETFKKDPDKYLKKLETGGVVPEPIPPAPDAK